MYLESRGAIAALAGQGGLVHNLVSVCILTRDRQEALQKCVLSILGSTYPRIEIIVYDNGTSLSQGKNSSFLSQIDHNSTVIKHIEVKPSGFAAMRRQAVSRSTGQIIMSIDDDCIAARDAISNIVNRFEQDPSLGIVGGHITNVGFQGISRFKGRGRVGKNGRYEIAESLAEADVFGSANMSFRRAAYDAAGGYDPFFDGGLEEADLTLSIKEQGFKVVYAPEVHITHVHVPTRFRSRWRSPDVCRLYLFFKHYMPNTPQAWSEFAAEEVRLYIDSVQLLISGLYSERQQSPRALARCVAGVAWSLIKITWARVLTPYLIIRAWRSRLRMGRSLR